MATSQRNHIYCRLNRAWQNEIHLWVRTEALQATCCARDSSNEADPDFVSRAPSDPTVALDHFWLDDEDKFVGDADQVDDQQRASIRHIANDAIDGRGGAENNQAAFQCAQSGVGAMLFHGPLAISAIQLLLGKASLRQITKFNLPGANFLHETLSNYGRNSNSPNSKGSVNGWEGTRLSSLAVRR